MFSGTATGVLWVALLLCLAGLGSLGYFACLVRRRISDVLAKAESPRRIGVLRGLITSLLGITLLALALAGFAFCLAFWNYRALTCEIPVAEITCQAVPGAEGIRIESFAPQDGHTTRPPAPVWGRLSRLSHLGHFAWTAILEPSGFALGIQPPLRV